MTIIASWLLLPQMQTRSPQRQASFLQKIRQFDWVGTLLLTASLTCLLLVLQYGGAVYSWSDARIIVLLVMFVVLLLAFVALQRRLGDGAVLPLRILGQRSIAFGFAYTIAVSAALETLQYYVSPRRMSQGLDPCF